MDEARLREIASACSRIVEHWSGYQVFSGYEIAERYDPLASLAAAEQFRVMVLLARVPVIATLGMKEDGAPFTGLAGWRFWARHRAPAGAYVPRSSS